MKNPVLLIVVFLFTLAACSQEQAGPELTVEELNSRLMNNQTLLVIDVRSQEEYSAGHIPGAINIPIDQFDKQIAQLENSKDQDIVVYCHSGPRAYSAQDKLRQAGFNHIYDLKGHFAQWESKGLAKES